MIKLDHNLLAELGLAALSAEDKERMLAHIYDTLEMRVGMELAKQMTEAQLVEFEEFIKRSDEAGALKWLETNFPNYKDVVAAEFEKLKVEIKQVAPEILRDAQAAAHQPQPQMQQPGQHSQAPYYGQQHMPSQGSVGVGPAPQQPYYPPTQAGPMPPASSMPSQPAQPGQSAPGYYQQPGQTPSYPPYSAGPGPSAPPQQ